MTPNSNCLTALSTASQTNPCIKLTTRNSRVLVKCASQRRPRCRTTTHLPHPNVPMRNVRRSAKEAQRFAIHLGMDQPKVDDHEALLSGRLYRSSVRRPKATRNHGQLCGEKESPGQEQREERAGSDPVHLFFLCPLVESMGN